MSWVRDPTASVDLESLGVSRVSLIYSPCLTPVLHFTALLAVVPLNTEVNPPTEVGLAELAACLKKDFGCNDPCRWTFIGPAAFVI